MPRCSVQAEPVSSLRVAKGRVGLRAPAASSRATSSPSPSRHADHSAPCSAFRTSSWKDGMQGGELFCEGRACAPCVQQVLYIQKTNAFWACCRCRTARTARAARAPDQRPPWHLEDGVRAPQMTAASRQPRGWGCARTQSEQPRERRQTIWARGGGSGQKRSARGPDSTPGLWSRSSRGGRGTASQRRGSGAARPAQLPPPVAFKVPASAPAHGHPPASRMACMHFQAKL